MGKSGAEGRNLKARVREELIRGSGLKRFFALASVSGIALLVREELIRGSGLKPAVTASGAFTTIVREELIRGSGLKLLDHLIRP